VVWVLEYEMTRKLMLGDCLERMKKESRVSLHHGDCLELMKFIPDNSIDMVLTDPL
jgi:DNA modification methylase